MKRKLITRRLTSVAEVRASIHAHRSKIGGKLDARQSQRSAAAGFSYQGYFDHMDAELSAVQQALVRADDLLVRARVRLAWLRRKSGELAGDLYRKQTATRQILAGFYGGDLSFELAAISGRTPEVPSDLVEQVDQTIKILRSPGGERPPQQVEGTVDVAALADDLERGLRDLRRVRNRLQRALKVADGAQTHSDAVAETFDGVFLWVARTLEGLFHLVDEHALADRIRTSIRRVTRRRDEDESEDPSDTTGPEPAPAGDEAPEPATDEPAPSPT